MEKFKHRPPTPPGPKSPLIPFVHRGFGDLDHLVTSTSMPASDILEAMTTPARRHLASSPFKPDPEPAIEKYALSDLVTHDSYGLGRVILVEAAAVTVDFSSQTVRIPSPFRKMSRL